MDETETKIELPDIHEELQSLSKKYPDFVIFAFRKEQTIAGLAQYLNSRRQTLP